MVSVPSALADRLFELAGDTSETYFHKRGTIAAGRFVGLLLDHFQEHLPSPDWMASKLTDIPLRGRKKKRGFNDVLDR